MSWITLTEAKVKTALSGPEYVAYTTKALAEGQDSPLPDIITQVAKIVRGYVAACTKNTLGAGLTIPEELEGAALDLIAWRLITRLPLSGVLLERIEKKKEDAEDLLKLVGTCKFAVEQPPAGEESEEDIPAAGTPRITPRDRLWTRANQEGF